VIEAPSQAWTLRIPADGLHARRIPFLGVSRSTDRFRLPRSYPWGCPAPPRFRLSPSPDSSVRARHGLVAARSYLSTVVPVSPARLRLVARFDPRELRTDPLVSAAMFLCPRHDPSSATARAHRRSTRPAREIHLADLRHAHLARLVSFLDFVRTVAIHEDHAPGWVHVRTPSRFELLHKGGPASRFCGSRDAQHPFGFLMETAFVTRPTWACEMRHPRFRVRIASEIDTRIRPLRPENRRGRPTDPSRAASGVRFFPSGRSIRRDPGRSRTVLRDRGPTGAGRRPSALDEGLCRRVFDPLPGGQNRRRWMRRFSPDASLRTTRWHVSLTFRRVVPQAVLAARVRLPRHPPCV
jgi:hypothetical protein